MSKNLTGMKFGRLTAVRPTDRRGQGGSVIWECECECGNRIYYSVSRLRSGCVQSCGCLYDDSRSRCTSYRQDLVEETSLSGLIGAKQCRNNNRSGYTGVCWNAQTGTWRAYINFQKKRYYLGFYRNLEDAVRERKKAEQRLHDPIIEEKFDCITRETQEKFREYLLGNSTEADQSQT